MNLNETIEILRNPNADGGKLTEALAYCTGEYAFRAGLLQDILSRKPRTWNAIRAREDIKSDTRAEREWEATDDGINETVYKLDLKKLEKMIATFRALIRVKDYLMSLTIDPVSIKDLCQIAGVSERTLQYTFQEYYGLTPNAYLKARRLNAVHSELKRSDPQSSSVINIASESGFWHMGQFAADYKKMFGCRPSETLYRID